MHKKTFKMRCTKHRLKELNQNFDNYVKLRKVGKDKKHKDYYTY